MRQYRPTHHAFSHDTAGYAARAARHAPGLHDVYRRAGLLLAERVPPSGRVLVLGAGGGLELRAFADMQPDWRFDGVDPSAEMIDQAIVNLVPDLRRPSSGGRGRRSCDFPSPPTQSGGADL